jgi:hypothetical protein
MILLSCKHSDDDAIFDRYLIEMDTSYRFSKVTYFADYDKYQYEKSYEYYSDHVTVRYSSGSPTIYYINNDGLADSSTYEKSRTKYFYNHDQYMTSYSSGGPVITFQYIDGNRSGMTEGHNSASYKYNSIINLIDINAFEGNYLGRLNKNLVQSASLRFAMASNGLSITYQYQTNKDGLVISRTAISKFNSGSEEKKITGFEYIIK